MRLLAYLAVVAALVFGGMACGGAKPAQEATQAQATQQAGKDAAPGLGDMARGFEAMAKSAKEMEELSKRPPVEPVSFKVLAPFFPDLAGWEKGTPEGEKMSAPVAISNSQVDYTKDEARITAKITDSGNNAMFLAPFMIYLTAGYEKETSGGYEKSVKIGDQPGWERWDNESKSGTLNIFVNKRFLVELDGNGIENTQVLHDLAGRIDLRQLGEVK